MGLHPAILNKKFLREINVEDVPSNFTTFYKQNRENEKEKELKINLLS